MFWKKSTKNNRNWIEKKIEKKTEKQKSKSKINKHKLHVENRCGNIYKHVYFCCNCYCCIFVVAVVAVVVKHINLGKQMFVRAFNCTPTTSVRNTTRNKYKNTVYVCLCVCVIKMQICPHTSPGIKTIKKNELKKKNIQNNLQQIIEIHAYTHTLTCALQYVPIHWYTVLAKSKWVNIWRNWKFWNENKQIPC